jgi:hypothetical protein
MATASSFPFWKIHAAKWFRDSVVNVASGGLAIILLIAVVYVLGPYIFTPQAKGPSADEIATAILQKLPAIATVREAPAAEDIAKVTGPIQAQLAAVINERDSLKRQIAAIPPSPPFVSPIHEKSQKWDFAIGIRTAILRSGLSDSCHVTIVRLQVPFAEQAAADFKDILNAIGWKFDEQFATSTVDRDITIRALNSPGPSKDCAEALSNRLRNIGQRRGQNGINDPQRWLIEPEAPIYLKQCPTGCVEVDFGNESDQ